jgi:hypothetical protein
MEGDREEGRREDRVISFEDNFAESPMSIRWTADFLPGEVFRMCYPENFNARAGPRPHFLVHCRKDLTFTWEFGEDRAEASGSDPVGKVHVVLAANEEERALEWSMSFTNVCGEPLCGISAFNCLNLANTPLFRDLALERTRVHDEGGEWVALKDVPKMLGEDTVKQYYPCVGGIDLKHHLSTSQTTGWGISSAVLSGDRIVVDSVDGKWTLESIVDGPVAYFFTNWAADDAGCVHAAALFGDVQPGDKTTVEGQIRFTPRI